MDGVDLISELKSIEMLDWLPAVVDTDRRRRNEERVGTNTTLLVLTHSVGSFEERIFELVKQFAHRFMFIENATRS
jgi:hypothetical protein